MIPSHIQIKKFKQKEFKTGFVNGFTGKPWVSPWKPFLVFVENNAFIDPQTQHLTSSYDLFSKVL